MYRPMKKAEDLKSRLALASVVKKYLRKARPCLRLTQAAAIFKKLIMSRNNNNNNKKNNVTGKVVLVDAKENPLATFEEQIGAGSAFGLVYAHSNIQCSSKIMTITEENTTEIAILKFLTKAAEKGFSPNFPIMYESFACDTSSPNSRDMPKFLQKPYYMAFSELADDNLEHWYSEPHAFVEHVSVMAQIHVAILALHMTGIVHDDAHIGNFLVHETTTSKGGGYWWYTIGGKDVFIKNAGYLVVIWDFGTSDTSSANSDMGHNYEYALNTATNALHGISNNKNRAALLLAEVTWHPSANIAKEQGAVLKKLESMASMANDGAAVVVSESKKNRPRGVINAKPFLSAPWPRF